MIAVFAAAFLMGLSLVYWGGPWLIAIGVASIACGIAYTGGPWPLAYIGLGDVFVFLFFGLVAVGGTYFVQAGRVTTDAVLAGVPIGLLATNILVVNNYRDVETDAAANKRTLVVRLGRRAARIQFNASLLVAFAMPLLSGHPETAAHSATAATAFAAFLCVAVPLPRGEGGAKREPDRAKPQERTERLSFGIEV